MAISFAAPASGGEGPAAADVNGHVLVIEPLSYEESVTTVHGPKDAVRLRLHDISTQATYEDCLWFGGYLVGSLKGRVGDKVLAQMGQGNAVQVVPVHAELTTQQAADFLNVSRPYLIERLEAGELPFRKVGKHRRVRFEDVLRYKKRTDYESKLAMTELTALSQELGLY